MATGNSNGQGAGAPRVMRSPRSIDVEITSRCNLRCKYCYYFENPQVEYEDLPAAEWLRFFEECGEAGVMDLSIAGGEPFIREDLRELLKGVVRNRMRFALLSNGGLIDDSIAEFLARTGRCDYVQVSIDGSRAETHDACRGRGSWEGAVRGVRTLQRNGVGVAVRLTIHRYNVDDLEATARFLLEELGLNSFGTNSAGYLGVCQRNAGGVMLTTQDRQRAMETLLRLNERYDGRITASAGPLAEGRTWKDMEEARRRGDEEWPGRGHLTACGCTNSKMAIRADGAYVVCNMLAHAKLGRMHEDSLVDVWQRHPDMMAMRHRHEIPLGTFEHCKGCEYIGYCTGNCPGLAYSMTGKINHPSPDACLRRYLQDGGKIPGIETGAPAGGGQLFPIMNGGLG